jgi:AcrR family transcriptional regulator
MPNDDTRVFQSRVDHAVLEGARRALTKWGRGATLDQIAREAGLSRVTLYRRGLSREAIVETLVARALEEYRAALWPALTGTGTGRERLELALRGLCDVAEGYLGLFEALPVERDALFHEDAAGDEEALTRSAFTDPLARLLEDGAADGTLRPADDPAETATLVFNQVGWTYIHLRTGHRWKPDRAKGAIVRLTLEGLSA